MENYICINGKKAELTEEQMKALGIELPKKNPFERAKNQLYYAIHGTGQVHMEDDYNRLYDNAAFSVGNYCTDKVIMEQRALHETLNRLLWRYSMEHNGDKINWGNVSDKWAIYYEHDTKKYKVAEWNTVHYYGSIYFYTREIAEAAIKEIIIPFMKAHPEFKW